MTSRPIAMSTLLAVRTSYTWASPLYPQSVNAYRPISSQILALIASLWAFISSRRRAQLSIFSRISLASSCSSGLNSSFARPSILDITSPTVTSASIDIILSRIAASRVSLSFRQSITLIPRCRLGLVSCEYSLATFPPSGPLPRCSELLPSLQLVTLSSSLAGT